MLQEIYMKMKLDVNFSFDEYINFKLYPLSQSHVIKTLCCETQRVVITNVDCILITLPIPLKLMVKEIL